MNKYGSTAPVPPNGEPIDEPTPTLDYRPTLSLRDFAEMFGASVLSDIIQRDSEAKIRVASDRIRMRADAMIRRVSDEINRTY